MVKNKFWMSGTDFENYLYGAIVSDKTTPLIEIAVSLHDIAIQLAELNNHLPPLEEEV